MLLALCEFLNTCFGFFGIDIPWFSYIGGISLIPLLFIYLASWVFGFCVYHRLFLYYTFVVNIVNIIDYTIGIPVSTYALLGIHSIILGVFITLILIYYRREQVCEKCW